MGPNRYFRYFKHQLRTGGTAKTGVLSAKSSAGINLHSRAHERKDQFGKANSHGCATPKGFPFS